MSDRSLIAPEADSDLQWALTAAAAARMERASFIATEGTS